MLDERLVDLGRGLLAHNRTVLDQAMAQRLNLGDADPETRP